MIGIPTFGADGGKSGIGTYLMALLKEWSKDPPDASMEIILYPDERELFLSSPAFNSCSVPTFWRNPSRNLLWHQLVLPFHAARRGYEALFLPAGNRRLPWWSPCPTVAAVHDLASLHMPEKYNKWHATYARRILPALIRRQTYIIAVSEFTKRDILEFTGLPEERISVIYEAADSELYFPREPQLCQAYVERHLQIRRPYILYLARIEHPGKNHVRLLRAFDRLKYKLDFPHMLVLAGSDWDRADEVHAVHQACRHREDIHFTGFLPSASIPYLYGGASLFVFPSLFEGFGLPLLEAMASGIPVACSDRACLPEIAGGAAIFFNPELEDEIQWALQALLENQTLRESLVTKGFRRNEQFSWRSAARQTLALLLKAASSG